MRVEALDLQEPVILLLVGFQKLQPGANGAVRKVILLGRHGGAVNQILRHSSAAAAAGFVVFPALPVDGGLLHLPFPAVPLLATDKFKGGVAGVIGRPAVAPVVLVVSHQMAMDTSLLHGLKGREIKRLYRPPATVQKVIAPGVQLPAGRHAGHAPDVKVIKLR
ncbi:hypothetical protein D3C75_942580 [compost metagenome]